MGKVRHTTAISLLIGVMYLVFVLNASEWVHGHVTVDIAPYHLSGLSLFRQLQVWTMYPGIVLLGAGSTYAYLTRRYITPGLAVLLPFLIALWFEAQSDVSGSILLGMADVYRLFWFVTLGFALLALGLELGIRRARKGWAGASESG